MSMAINKRYIYIYIAFFAFSIIVLKLDIRLGMHLEIFNFLPSARDSQLVLIFLLSATPILITSISKTFRRHCQL